MEIKAPKFNEDNLYEIHTYTDIALGTISHHIPIKTCVGVGAVPYRDHTRPEIFVGNTILHTTRGPMNVNFPIEAASLHDAVLNFNLHLNKMMKEMQDQQLRNKLLSPMGGTLNNNKKN